MTDIEPKSGQTGTLIDGRVTYSTTAAMLSVDTTWEQYEEVGAFFQLNSASSDWWLGDWLVFGGEMWGDEQYQAVVPGMFDPQRMVGCLAAAKGFPPETRRDDLSFEHHSVISMKLEGSLEDREAWLEKAKVNGWQVSQLAKAIKDYQSIETTATDDTDGDGKPKTEPKEALIRVSVRIDIAGLDQAMDLKGVIEADVRSTLEQNGIPVKGCETAWSKS